MDEWLKLSKEDREKEIQEQSGGQEIIDPDPDLLGELDDLLIGGGVRIDFNFKKLFKDSHWCLKTKDFRGTNNLYYLAYTQQKELEAEGAKLLYFKPSKYYQQLKYASDIWAKY